MQRIHFAGLALVALSVVACRSPGPYGYSAQYVPVSEEEKETKGAREYDPVMFSRDPDVWRKQKAVLFGVVTGRSAGPGGAAYVTMSVRKLETRNLLNVRALAFHELAPGHHFQISLQSENRALPLLRREGRHTAFIEGWGEYASSLGNEAGLFSNPYDQYGRLMMDMFLSVRLVVDTGMNALGWSRERAMDYMREHTLESEEQIHTESLRYSVDMPGQALAYKMGSRGFRDLRAKAERALGSAFDVRRFHDVILTSGSMPMKTLEAHVDRWIKEMGKQPEIVR